jgi:hypothetical protein
MGNNPASELSVTAGKEQIIKPIHEYHGNGILIGCTNPCTSGVDRLRNKASKIPDYLSEAAQWTNPQFATMIQPWKGARGPVIVHWTRDGRTHDVTCPEGVQVCEFGR